MTETTNSETGSRVSDPAFYRVWTQDHVRYADVDMFGHANNNAIGVYFESARIAAAREAGILDAGYGLALVRLVIEFKRELRMDDRVRVGSRVERVGRTSITLRQGLFRDDEFAAASEAVVVLFDLGTRRPVEIPAELRAALEAQA